MEEEDMPGWIQFFCGSRKRKLFTSISIFAVLAALIASATILLIVFTGVYRFCVYQPLINNVQHFSTEIQV